MPKFKRKPIIVTAYKLTHITNINSLFGERVGLRGDWLVTYEDGQQCFYKDEEFRKRYDPIDEIAEEYIKTANAVFGAPDTIEEEENG